MPSITVTIPHIAFCNTVTELYFVKYFPVMYHFEKYSAIPSPKYKCLPLSSLCLISCFVIQSPNYILWSFFHWCIISKSTVQYRHLKCKQFQLPSPNLTFCFLIQSPNYFLSRFFQWCIISKVQYNTVTQHINDFNYRHYTSYFVLSYSHQTTFCQFFAGFA